MAVAVRVRRVARPAAGRRTGAIVTSGFSSSEFITSEFSTSGRNPAVETQLRRARDGLAVAASATSAAERFVAAHLSALRAASAILAARARPLDASGRRQPPRSVWALLPAVAPELVEWSAFFAAGAPRRAAAEAGVSGAVSPRDADDLLRDASTFLALVETTLGLPHQEMLPTAQAALRAS